MANNIEFDNPYPKLHGQTSAKLVGILYHRNLKKVSRKLIEYDTRRSDGTYYPLPRDTEVFQLIFVGNAGIPFSTFRKKNDENIDKFFDRTPEIQTWFGLPFMPKLNAEFQIWINDPASPLIKKGHLLHSKKVEKEKDTFYPKNGSWFKGGNKKVSA